MRICVDPGHSAIEPGIVGSTQLSEADAVLRFALLLKQYLNKLGHEVVLTRTDEQAPAESPRQDLKRRGSIARYMGCQALLSIHGASATAGSGEVAVRYPQGEGLSAQLAVLVYKHLMEKTALAGRGVIASYETGLLRSVRIPAIQVELALFGDPHLEALLQDAEWLDTATQACGEAVTEWQARYWTRWTIGESEVNERTQTESAVNADETEELSDASDDAAPADTDEPMATPADNAQTTSTVPEDADMSRSKTVSPIAVHAQMADGAGHTQQISTEAQARLDALSQTAMERLSRLTGVESKQTSAGGVTARLTVSTPAENAVPKRKAKAAKRAETDTSEDAKVSTQSELEMSKRATAAAIPVPVVHSSGGRSGARSSFRASAVVQTPRGRTPIAVKVDKQAKKSAGKGSPAEV